MPDDPDVRESRTSPGGRNARDIGHIGDDNSFTEDELVAIAIAMPAQLPPSNLLELEVASLIAGILAAGVDSHVDTSVGTGEVIASSDRSEGAITPPLRSIPVGHDRLARRRSVLSSVSVSVVIPALNEAANLPWLLERMPREIAEVILVDGWSTDGTVEVAKQLLPSIRVIQQTGRGRGNAIASGFMACRGDIIVMLDADGSTDPTQMPKFVEALLTGADFAKGSRFVPGGGTDSTTRIRRLGIRALSALVNVLWGAQFTDLFCTYNAFWRRCLPQVLPYCDGFEVEALMSIAAVGADLTIAEVPSVETARRYGVSNLSARRNGVRILRSIIAERVGPKRSEAGRWTEGLSATQEAVEVYRGLAATNPAYKSALVIEENTLSDRLAEIVG